MFIYVQGPWPRVGRLGCVRPHQQLETAEGQKLDPDLQQADRDHLARDESDTFNDSDDEEPDHHARKAPKPIQEALRDWFVPAEATSAGKKQVQCITCTARDGKDCIMINTSDQLKRHLGLIRGAAGPDGRELYNDKSRHAEAVRLYQQNLYSLDNFPYKEALMYWHAAAGKRGRYLGQQQ
jgi:hypothetical protein